MIQSLPSGSRQYVSKSSDDRQGVVGEPPPKEGGRLTERPAKNLEPRAAELGLERQAAHNPLRRSPEERGHERSVRGAPGPRGSWSRSWRPLMSVAVRPECRVARGVRRMPDGVARKLEYLGRDSTRASQLLRDFLRHAALQLRRGHEAAISRWVAPLSVTSCLSVSLMDMDEPFASLSGVNPIEALTDASPGSACERAKGHPDRASAFRRG
jgi:hypothetical protein